LVAGLAPLDAGCGDPPQCQSEVFVAFQQAVITSAAGAPLVAQMDIHIRTSLEEGEPVTLEVFAADGTAYGTITRLAGAGGRVLFVGVPVPAPRAVLRATARGLCGEGSDEITLDVAADADCAVSLVPAPEPSVYYAPLGVLAARTDPDPVTPGYQT